MSMKEAFDTFFEKNNNSWKKVWRTLPRVSKIPKYSQSPLVVNEDNINGELEWQPQLQDMTVDFKLIEEELGFEIHPQVKEYLTTYWFMPLKGKTSIVDQLVLEELLPQTQTDFSRYVKDCFNKKQYHYLDSGEYFLIGGFCCIDGNDSYIVHVNNDTGEVTAVQNFDKISIKIADSIEELLYKMKGIWD